jgi:hypothetical protein
MIYERFATNPLREGVVENVFMQIEKMASNHVPGEKRALIP